MSASAVRRIRAATIQQPTEASTLNQRRAMARNAMTDFLFLFPWKWLGLTHAQWTSKKCSYEVRVTLWN